MKSIEKLAAKRLARKAARRQSGGSKLDKFMGKK